MNHDQVRKNECHRFLSVGSFRGGADDFGSCVEDYRGRGPGNPGGGGVLPAVHARQTEKKGHRTRLAGRHRRDAETVWHGRQTIAGNRETGKIEEQIGAFPIWKSQIG